MDGTDSGVETKVWAGEIKELRDVYDNAKAALHQAVLEFREICPHADVIECEYQPMLGSPLPPAALCVDCGIEEHTWMFRVLKPTRKVHREGPDGLYAHRFGPHFNERLKTDVD